jgi:hypothetical protein
VGRDLLVIWFMGSHHAPQQHHGLGGLVGRGALTAAAALALAGGGAGVAPAGGDQDASQSRDHGDDCSCDGHDNGQDHDGRQDDDSWQDRDSWQGSDANSDSDDPGWMSFGSDDHEGRSSTKDCDRGDGGPGMRPGDAAPTSHGGTTHGSGRQTGSHAPSSENISHAAAQGGTKTVPISSGVMR